MLSMRDNIILVLVKDTSIELTEYNLSITHKKDDQKENAICFVNIYEQV